MNKNIWIVVLIAAAVGLSIMVGIESGQIAGLKEQMRMMADAEKAAAKLAPTPVPSEEAPAPVAEAKLVQPVVASAPVPQTTPESGRTNGIMSGFAQMMKNPQMKEMMRNQQKVGITSMYGALSKYLNLSTNDMEALNQLLLDRQMAMVDSGMDLMNGSGADPKQAATDAQAVRADYDKKIQDLLGPENYPVFQDYEKTAADRMSVQMFKGSLPADATLTDQQEDSLVTAMYEERKALPATSMVNNQTPDPSKFTEEGIADTLKQMQELQQRDAQRAASILTPAQLDQFTKFQEQMNGMQEAGLKMAAQMFGNKSATPAPTAGTSP